jgi:glyoxylase-like metal-dependent hydrolase (beta-lactamase superfamily II)
MPGWRWIHTPGHTAGHVSLFRDADRTLVAGDAFVTTRQESLLAVAAQAAEVHGPPAYFTPDWEHARRSVEQLAALEPEVAATGHGIPMFGEEMRRALHALARNFEREAVPARGRYVDQPAVADERGVVRVPPAIPAGGSGALLAVGAAFAAGILLASRSRTKRTRARRSRHEA